MRGRWDRSTRQESCHREPPRRKCGGHWEPGSALLLLVFNKDTSLAPVEVGGGLERAWLDPTAYREVRDEAVTVGVPRLCRSSLPCQAGPEAWTLA